MDLILKQRYLTIEPLGRGGFGQAFLTRDLSFSNHFCVLKQLSPRVPLQPAQLEDVQKLFNAEADVLRGLKHPQIPQVTDRFSLPVPDNSGAGHFSLDKRLFYLVQDYVPGRQGQLPENLLQELNRTGNFSEAQVRELLASLLKVLDYLHKQANDGKGLIHRDIKPENIIRHGRDRTLHLIDFGAVKRRLEPGVPLAQSITIGTLGYAPNEQLLGRNIDDTADLYALAATCVHLLTGTLPEAFNRGSIFDPSWREKTQISDELFAVLTKMLLVQPEARYRTAQAVLQAIEQGQSKVAETHWNAVDPIQETEQAPTEISPDIKTQTNEREGVVLSPPRFSGWLRKAAIALCLALSAFLLAIYLPGSWREPKSARQPGFSLGEELLVKEVQTPAKREGITAFAKQDYALAISHFQDSLKGNQNDPESRIYLNNAQMSRQPGPEPYRIAVSVPIGSNVNVAQEILRGVAQAQDELNKTPNRILNQVGLQVEIINDNNDKALAERNAHKLIKDSTILAVVGHNASEPSMAAASVYQAGGLTMITPTSLVSDLTRSDQPYIFRAVQTPSFMSERLAKYAIETAKKRNIATCYDAQSYDGLSFRKEFIAYFRSAGGSDVGVDCNFRDPAFNANAAISKAINAGAEALLVTPHIDRLDPAIALAKANQGRLTLLANTTLYTIKILEGGGEAFNGLVLATPWHVDRDPNNPFADNAYKLWNAPVNWRSAGGYDATRAIIAALQQQQTREGLQSVLRDPKFKTTGARDIRFFPSGDLVGTPVLVKVQPSPNTQAGYNFVLFDEDAVQNADSQGADLSEVPQ